MNFSSTNPLDLPLPNPLADILTHATGGLSRCHPAGWRNIYCTLDSSIDDVCCNQLVELGLLRPTTFSLPDAFYAYEATAAGISLVRNGQRGRHPQEEHYAMV